MPSITNIKSAEPVLRHIAKYRSIGINVMRVERVFELTLFLPDAKKRGMKKGNEATLLATRISTPAYPANGYVVDKIETRGQ